MSKQEQLLKPRKAGAILDVSPRTITRWCREGRLHGVKIGRLWRVPTSEVERMRDGQEQ